MDNKEDIFVKIRNYTVIKEEMIKELNGTAYLLQHDKTKARVLVVRNEDNNKVFNIGFRTPPTDDTGVPHITEHSVLCGSRKFPVKDPFVELAKGSLNTFLNAMTYPDKTVYPVASVNEKDFHNLMDVYLDAVFYPNTYHNDKILKQEGWHYHIEKEDDPITYNGVVYNEMKGAYSSAEQQLMQAIQKSLLPDTTYGCDSGGDPKVIPELTYEAFLDFHRKFYHPSNSYIYLYGDVDVEKELAFIDEEYLSAFDYLEVDSRINPQPAFDQAKEITVTYPLADAEEEEENTYLSYNVVVGDSLDRTLNLAFMMLDYALIDVPGAPIKKALVDAGISNDVFSSYDDGILQPVYSIVAKGCRQEDKERFVTIIEQTLEKLVRDGLEKKVLEASLNHFEFKLKEANYGRFPKGLMYGLSAFNSWLYCNDEPFMYLKYDENFACLKEKIGTDYYQNILKEYILTNTHKTIVTGVPKKGLNKENEAELAKQLQAYKSSLSEEQIKQLVKDTEELQAYQSEPSLQEDLEKIPLLQLSDIDKKAFHIKNREWQAEGIPVVQQDIFTNGIAYISYYFMLDHVPVALLPYVSLLTALYKEVDTDQHTYGTLANEIDLKTGGIGLQLSSLGVRKELGEYKVSLAIKTKVLDENVPDALALMEEILFTSHITDKKRMKEVLAELISQMKMTITDNGHTAMANRALSYFSKGAYLKEMLEGITFYEFANALYKNFDESYDNICRNLKAALASMARPENLIISYTGMEDLEQPLEKAVVSLKNYMTENGEVVEQQQLPLAVLNEGFQTASKVQYAAQAGNFLEEGYVYTGALSVLQVIFSYDYLWINVRVKGGAYGCMCNFNRIGDAYFTSYRDPNLSRTYDVYRNVVDYVKNFEASDRDMVKYIIGAIAKLDAPMTPSAEGAYDFICYLSGITDEQLQKDRDEVLHVNVETIRSLAPYMEAILSKGCYAALGDEEVIKKEADFFKEIKTLI
ncbi:MAG: insulinase family protein [Lachnospiraceae bacterium]|nr:insulinase family protein [Lachnospiraceae bacterium]